MQEKKLREHINIYKDNLDEKFYMRTGYWRCESGY